MKTGSLLTFGLHDYFYEIGIRAVANFFSNPKCYFAAKVIYTLEQRCAKFMSLFRV